MALIVLFPAGRYLPPPSPSRLRMIRHASQYHGTPGCFVPFAGGTRPDGSPGVVTAAIRPERSFTQRAAGWGNRSLMAMRDCDVAVRQTTRLLPLCRAGGSVGTRFPYPPASGNPLSGQVEGGTFKILHPVQCVDMDEVVIRGAETLTKRCANIIPSDPNAAPAARCLAPVCRS